MSTPDKPLAEHLVVIRESTSQLLEAVDGYRSECLQRGYSETAAEVMALKFHDHMLSAMFASTAK